MNCIRTQKLLKILVKVIKKDVALFVSLNGETQELVVAGKNCYDSEIGTILLTASKHSSLMKYIEIPFVGFKSEGSFFPIMKCVHGYHYPFWPEFYWTPML